VIRLRNRPKTRVKAAGVLVTLGLLAAGCSSSDEDCSVTGTCPNTAPSASITSPPDGSSFDEFVSVSFAGSATDAEDGALTGTSIVWTSSLDGAFGTGGVSFSKTDLSLGVHTIILTATDSEGATGADSIQVTIAGISITAPVNQGNGAPHTVFEGTGVTFTATATDPEDGPLTGASVVWTSNVDGQIGTGTSFMTSVLTEGMHTVTLTATDSDSNETKETVLVIVKPADAAGFQIQIRLSEGVTLSVSQQAAVDAAKAKMEAMITGDVADFGLLSRAAGSCGGASTPALNESIDDLIIYLEFVPIDGPMGTVGSAGWCLARGGSLLPLLGGMKFDTADLDFIESLGLLEAIIRHEMMHVLGFGVTWDFLGLLNEPSDSTNANFTPGSTDTFFDGPAALTEFAAIGGGSYTGGNIVPVENDTTTYGTGSLDGHWREGVFFSELMTPSANVGANPLSSLTIASFEDLGYTVDLGEAEAYSQTFSIVFGDQAKPQVIDLSGDVWQGQLHVVEPDGTLRRIR